MSFRNIYLKGIIVGNHVDKDERNKEWQVNYASYKNLLRFLRRRR